MSEGSGRSESMTALVKSLHNAQKKYIRALIRQEMKQAAPSGASVAKRKKPNPKPSQVVHPPNPDCNGLLYPEPKKCQGGGRADKLRVWASRDNKVYCHTCLGSNQRREKKLKKESD